MTEIASIFQTIQLGVESTSGSSVAANKKLLSMGVEPGVSAEITTFRPAGMKYSTLTALNKEWTEAGLTGYPTYSEIIYPLSSVLCATSASSLGGSPAAYSWIFNPSAVAADTVKTFTIEQGDATRAHKFTYGLVTGLTFNFSRDENGIEGTMIGQAMTDDITMTATPTSIELIPVLPTQVTVYLDDTYAGLGGTALTRPISVSWQIGDRFNPLWALNASYTSFAAIVEAEPLLQVVMKMEADAAGMGLLATMRTGATKFMRIEAVGETISGGNKYKLTIDTAVKVSDVAPFSDEDGVYAIEWTMVGVYDAAWGKVCNWTVINKQATL